MGLPTPVKTWRTAHATIGIGSDANDQHKLAMFAIYNALKGRNPTDTGALAWLDSNGASASAPTVFFTMVIFPGI